VWPPWLDDRRSRSVAPSARCAALPRRCESLAALQAGS
jgi:hypothetical protein